jgi:RNA polymerase sigma factor (sigma-70 family)
MSEENELAERARLGDREALDTLLGKVEDLVFNLAIRMLGNPAEAEDMSQEILMRVVNGLASFRGESAFRTWVYRVASNHLLSAKKRLAEERFDSFDAMGAYLDGGIASSEAPLDHQVLVNEAKLRCTSAMLLCLDRDHRLAFILGEVLELSSEEAAEILEISDEAMRKRLSRARERLTEFMLTRCSLVDQRLACSCGKQAAFAVKKGTLDPNAPSWAACPTRAAPTPTERPAPVDELDALERAVVVFRSHPDYLAPSALVRRMRGLIETPTSDLLR